MSTAPNACVPAPLIVRLAPGSGPFASEDDWTPLLEACIEHLPKVHAASILRLRRDGNLHFVAGAGLDIDLLRDLVVPPSALQVSPTGGTLIGFRVNEQALDDAQRFTIGEAAREIVLRSSMSAPLRPGGQLIGYLQLDSRDDDAFDESDALVATAIGEIVSARFDRGEFEPQFGFEAR